MTLAGGPARVVDLTGSREISRPAISRHLRILGEAGLVAADPRGRERWYALRVEGLAPVVGLLRALDSTRAPVVTETMLDALDLEVRRTVRSTVSNALDRHKEKTA